MKNKLVVFFIILLSILALACKNEKASPEKQKIKVQAQPINTVLISEKVFFNAFIRPLCFLLPPTDFNPRIDQGIDKVQQEYGNRE